MSKFWKQLRTEIFLKNLFKILNLFLIRLLKKNWFKTLITIWMKTDSTHFFKNFWTELWTTIWTRIDSRFWIELRTEIFLKNLLITIWMRTDSTQSFQNFELKSLEQILETIENWNLFKELRTKINNWTFNQNWFKSY